MQFSIRNLLLLILIVAIQLALNEDGLWMLLVGCLCVLAVVVGEFYFPVERFAELSQKENGNLVWVVAFVALNTLVTIFHLYVRTLV